MLKSQSTFISGQNGLVKHMLRDWSLITGRGGGLQTGRGGGGVNFTPTKKRGGGKSFSQAEGQAKNVLGWFYAVALSLSHIEGGGAQKVLTL